MNLFIVIMRFFIGMCVAMWNGMMSIINKLIEGHNKRVIEENNRISRGVIEDKSISSAQAFDDGCTKNSLISGSEEFIRAELVSEAIKYADTLRRPVIVIHESNNELEISVQNSLGNTVTVINSSNPCYDPFRNLTDDEIVKIILETSKKWYGVKDSARYCIKGMIGCLRAAGREPSLKSFASCPYKELYGKVDGLISKGKLSSNTGEQIKSDLMKGQDELSKLEGFFADLLFQSESIIASNSNASVYDVTRAVKEGKILIIDITSSLNTLLIDIIINSIKIVMNHYNLTVVLDGISVDTNNENLKKFICTNNKKCTITYSTPDLYSAVCSDEKVFYTIIGNSEKNIIMQHLSAVSADKWSKAIGYYDKTESTYTYSKGKTKGGISLFPSYNVNEATNYSTKREEIVKTDQIQRMQNNEVYIFDRSQNQLLHSYLL